MKVRIGISSCLLGQKVRFDGGHKNCHFCLQDLSPFVEYQSVCPEMAIGLPSPRPAIRLQHTTANQIRLVQSSDDTIEHTSAMQHFIDAKLPQLQQLSGYIVCAKSPTCGMERVKLYDDEGNVVSRQARGMFTHQLMQKYPWLPVEEDGRLSDPALRENFVCRVFSCHDFQQSMQEGFSIAKLVAFHSRYKFLVMAHSPQAYRELGRLVANSGVFNSQELQQRYLNGLMQALSQIATRKQHANVLQHLQGFFKKQLSSEARQELAEVIHRYRQGFAPLLAPVTLLHHHLRQFPQPYVAAQRYFSPYPEQLGLRA